MLESESGCLSFQNWLPLGFSITKNTQWPNQRVLCQSLFWYQLFVCLFTWASSCYCRIHTYIHPLSTPLTFKGHNEARANPRWVRVRGIPKNTCHLFKFLHVPRLFPRYQTLDRLLYYWTSVPNSKGICTQAQISVKASHGHRILIIKRREMWTVMLTSPHVLMRHIIAACIAIISKSWCFPPCLIAQHFCFIFV